MKVLFLHGLGVEPGGVQPDFLRRNGLHVIEPALPHGDFEGAVVIAQDHVETHNPEVVVGCSRGGAVAMELDAEDMPLVLLAPAWRKWGRATTVGPDTMIIHSPRDRVIRFEDSQLLLRNSQLPERALGAVGADHFLSDGGSLEQLLEAVLTAGSRRALV